MCRLCPTGLTASLWYTLEDSSRAAVAQKDVASDTQQKSTPLMLVLAIAFLLLVAITRHTLNGGDTLTRQQTNLTLLTFVLSLLAAFALRVYLGASIPGYQVDMNCFSAWSLHMASEGPWGFYSKGYFCDYPPGYMLLLWPVGLLIQAIGYAESPEIRLLVKAIPILCDMAVAMVLFQYGKETHSAARGGVCSIIVCV